MTNKLLLAVIILMELAILGAVVYLKFFRWSDDDVLWTLCIFWILVLSTSTTVLVLYSATSFYKCRKWGSSLWKVNQVWILSAAGEELKICGLDRNLQRLHGSGSWDLHCFIRLLMSLAWLLAATQPYNWLSMRILSEGVSHSLWFHLMISQHWKSWKLMIVRLKWVGCCIKKLL